ncbi:hypothetical protein [Microcella sp.]|uniref:hypothetical protein n=1 Tax=Microcella sp. TaxID=1913979 RepID=UPI00299F698B|nr:hypothetical protein [Microcella sp.]MDX2026502.1 hypothetical protein [Microcella sp.]
MARASSPSPGIDPRYPEAFQRGGAATGPVVDGASAVRTHAASRPAPASAPGVRDSLSDTPARNDRVTDAQLDVPADRQHFELIVAGNPWLRSLWIVGAVATLAGFALTVYAEFAFSVPPASGIYDPSVYVVPRIADAAALPLVIAGVIALVAATALRIVAWRPSRVTEVSPE